mgnify:CR=1 FL=1
MIIEFDIYLRNKDMDTINNIIAKITETLRKAGVEFRITRENIPKKFNILHTIYIKVFNDYDGSSKKVLNIILNNHQLVAAVDVYIKKSI